MITKLDVGIIQNFRLDRNIFKKDWNWQKMTY